MYNQSEQQNLRRSAERGKNVNRVQPLPILDKWAVWKSVWNQSEGSQTHLPEQMNHQFAGLSGPQAK